MANMAMRDQSERKIEVNREKLIVTLTANRASHVAKYQEAVDGYKEAALAKLGEAHKEAVKSLKKNVGRVKSLIDDFDPTKRGVTDHMTLVNEISVQLAVPRNFEKEYDAAIDMAKWDVRETLELTHSEFQCFVRDQWDWTADFTRSTIAYMKAK